jgi:hypothetical protein
VSVPSIKLKGEINILVQKGAECGYKTSKTPILQQMAGIP